MIKQEDISTAEDGAEVNTGDGAEAEDGTGAEDNTEEIVARSLLSDRLLADLSGRVGEEVRIDTILAGVTQKEQEN